MNGDLTEETPRNVPAAILLVMSLSKSHNWNYRAERKAIPVRRKFINGDNPVNTDKAAIKMLVVGL